MAEGEDFVGATREYLDQLYRLLAAPGAPAPDHLLRLARGVRGSARRAGAETIVVVAERLEDAARSVASQSIVWSEEIRALAAQTVRDLQVLVRARSRWGAEEERRVRDALERWDDGAADPRPVVDVAALFHDDGGPHLVSPSAAEDHAPTPVPVESLLLRGGAALREARALRPRVERALRREDPGPPLDVLLAELFDLIDLAADADAREE